MSEQDNLDGGHEGKSEMTEHQRQGESPVEDPEVHRQRPHEAQASAGWTGQSANAKMLRLEQAVCSVPEIEGAGMAELTAVSQIRYLRALWIPPKGSNTPQVLEERGSHSNGTIDHGR